jgi:hypothetical protein
MDPLMQSERCEGERRGHSGEGLRGSPWGLLIDIPGRGSGDRDDGKWLCWRFVTRRDAVTAQRARKVITAFAACECSHCVLRLAQFAGTTVQLNVAWFAG